MDLPKKYKPKEAEKKWNKYWKEKDIYKFNEDTKKNIFKIDTPPPTVSGNLHMGHLYGATLQDFVARFQRMRGKEVFFPFGYDDNGIASERLTERELGIERQNYTRQEFQKKCREVCEKYEENFTKKMQSLALSIDWSNTYKTIDSEVQKISQLSFIELYEKDREYRKLAPAIWCPSCETAISQVELEDKKKGSQFYDIEFSIADSKDNFTISTTRPELLPACVAVFIHPEDEKNKGLVGKKAKVPLFGQEVPILEDERVDMEKGSGIVMCCTFGDQTDIEWYQAHDLNLEIAIDESGTMTSTAGKYEGMKTKEARKVIVEDLDSEGYLLDKKDISHTVQAHERCGTDIEFLVTKQWYIKVLDKKEDYLKAGEKMNWYPEKMFTRYKNWVNGLQWDWLISRQRDSGIPFPVWYCKECDKEIIANRDQLPVDPAEDKPPLEKCPDCDSEDFVPEDDVLDTWATSSLTPLINAKWNGESIEREKLYPMNLRPQGHDIISFWLFHTIVKCIEHTNQVPFDSVMINGMVLDENSEKMSKSKGNVVSPEEVLKEFTVDAARYWAAGTSIGDDFPFKEKDLVTGEKLIRKLWNASKLVNMLVEDEIDLDESELEDIDRWMLAKLDKNIEHITNLLENYDFAKARDRLRSFFWNTFCDNYLEIAKQRLNESENKSAQYTLREVHKKFIKLFAPFLVHVTEELWQNMYIEKSSGQSIHTESWPESMDIETDIDSGDQAMEIIHSLRKFKTENRMALNDKISEITVYGTNLKGFESAIKKVMHVENIKEEKGNPEIETEISEIRLNYSILGPKYGKDVSKIEKLIQKDDYELSDDTIKVGDIKLSSDEFELVEERKYTGDGNLVEAGDLVLIIKA